MPENKARAFLDVVKPPLILMLICIISCFLLVLAYNITYVDTNNVITDKLQAACEEVMEGNNFTMLTNIDLTDSNINSIITNNSNQCGFEITTNGYNKDGLHLLVGIDERGSVTGVSIISIGETPGLGTKVTDKGYLSQFRSLTQSNILNDSKALEGVDGITGATYSSKGMVNAVTTALNAFEMYKGDIFNE